MLVARVDSRKTVGGLADAHQKFMVGGLWRWGVHSGHQSPPLTHFFAVRAKLV